MLRHPIGFFDARVKLHILPQVELIADEVHVLFRLLLAREMFLPFPFVQDLLREEEAIRVGLTIEPSSRIAV